MRIGLPTVFVGLLGLCVSGCSFAAEGEKLLFGFEKEEVEKVAQKDRGIAKFEDNGDYVFLVGTEKNFQASEMAAIRPMLGSMEKCSQGKYSCKVVEKNIGLHVARYPEFRIPGYRLQALHQAEPRANMRTPEIFNTSGWYEMVFPKDWSGYELLRVDVCIETADQVAKLMLEVEDEQVEPPVSLTFDPPPAGKWVTLEMDLAQAARERKLDVKNMANIWVRVDLKDMLETVRRLHRLVRDPAGKEEVEQLRFRAWVDNVRLAKRGAPSAYPVLEGKRSVYTAKLPRSYAVEEHMLKDLFPEPIPIPTDFQPAGEAKFMALNLMQRPMIVPASTEMPKEVSIPVPKGPVKLSGPSTAPIRDMIIKGCLDTKDENANIYNSVRLSSVAAAAPDYVLVGFYIFQMGSLRAGPTAQVPLGRLCTAAIATFDGGRTWKGLDGKSDWPTVMGGNISKVPPRLVDLGGNLGGVYQFGCAALGEAHIGYPTDRMFFVRTVFTGDAYWKSPKYFVSSDPRHCHNVGSGDLFLAPSGRIWGAWSGLDRHSFGDPIPSFSTWVHYSDDGGKTWTGWRGPDLNGVVPFVGRGQVQIVPYRGQVAVIGQKGCTVFDGKTWSPVTAIGVGPYVLSDCIAFGEEIYVSDDTGPVRRYDGKEWKPFELAGRTGFRGRIAVCGGKKMVFVEPDETGKKLLMWQKDGAEWRGPKELIAEQKPIVQLRVQRYAPESFVPVAYMCASAEELPKPDRKKTYDIIYGFDQYPPAGTPHEPWIKLLVVPVGEN